MQRGGEGRGGGEAATCTVAAGGVATGRQERGHSVGRTPLAASCGVHGGSGVCSQGRGGAKGPVRAALGLGAGWRF